MKSLSFLWRCLLVLGLTLGLAAYAFTHLHIEQDIVSSLEKSRPEEAALFHKLQGSGFFQDQLYVRFLKNDPALRERVITALKEAGYDLTDPMSPKITDPQELYALLPFLDDTIFQRLVSETHRQEILGEIKSWMNAPGGLGMIRLLDKDPLLLTREIPKLIGLTHSIDAPLVAKRRGDLDWEKTRQLYEFLKTQDQDVSFLAGDFFALENYDAVHHDIWICSILSTVLSLLVFRFFCRQWSLLLFLLFGTLLSSVVALIFAEAQYGALYGLVLAFASTFVSFNNESLVHLSGVNWEKPDRNTVIGVISAIGTTIIGFLVLLFSSSHLTKQLALLSLGSLAGFLGFLWIFRDRLEGFAFRSLTLPHFAWSKPFLYLSTLGLVLSFWLLPKPVFHTNLEGFRFATPYLEAQTERFAKTYKVFSFEALYAVPKKDYARLLEEGRIDTTIFHPLKFYRSLEQQKTRATEIAAPLETQYQALAEDLEREGIRTSFAQKTVPPKALDETSYLALWQKIWPLPWESGETRLVFLKPGADVPGAIPMHPRSFYEHILNDLSRNLAYLFGIGLSIMLLYLIPWQRSLARVLLIFFPLFLALIVLQILFYFTGRNLTILHIMGLALVISVALDYGSVLVSTDHDPKEQGKVVLTGGLTLCSFGSLLLAQHPVLHELALVVFLGTLVSWLMALFTRMDARGGEN